MSVYKFSSTGYDPFIDFLKGICILWVLFLHTFPKLELFGVALWAMNAVPLFLLIQVIHSFKKGVDKTPSFSISKSFLRVLFLFFITQSVILLLYYLTLDSESFLILVNKAVKNGGFGPGSYYPWLYCEIAFLLPITAYLFRLVNHKCLKYSNLIGGGIMLIISVINEVIFAYFDVYGSIWRLWCGRYLFIIWLGYIICQEGVYMNTRRWVLSLISISCLLIFEYLDPDLEPLFYNTGWKLHHWICYFYVAYLLLYFLRLIYVRIGYSIKRSIEYIGKGSYEIFLVQMSAIPLISRYYSFDKQGVIGLCIEITISFIISLGIGLLWSQIRQKYKK